MSKIDCSIAVNYIKEKARLTENCTISCGACMLSERNTGESMECYMFEMDMPEKAVEIIQEWSNAIPIKTRLKDFTEKYPNHMANEKGIPNSCCECLGYTKECSTNCEDCWDMPL